MPAVPRVIPLVAMARSLVRPGTLPALISVVMTFLLIFPGIICPLPGAASRARGAPTPGLVWLLGRILAVLRLPVAPYLGAFVGSASVRLSWWGVTSAP